MGWCSEYAMANGKWKMANVETVNVSSPFAIFHSPFSMGQE
jgi:hypothetical protein